MLPVSQTVWRADAKSAQPFADMEIWQEITHFPNDESVQLQIEADYIY